LGWMLVAGFLIQLFLIVGGVLPALSGIAVISVLPFAYGLAVLREKGPTVLLLSVFVHMVLMVIGVGLA